MIGIIDYKAGNGPSVLNALKHLGVDAALTAEHQQLEQCSHIILPGVGSAGATMASLAELDLIGFLEKQVLEEKKPFLGICVGLQVLFEHSEEEDATCLGWLKGSVRKFDAGQVRVPQIGWNKTVFQKTSPLLEGLNPFEYFYFVNSYYAVPKDEDIILSKTDYQQEFCSSVASGNIYASQFHIEKSGSVGLKMLSNFITLGKE